MTADPLTDTGETTDIGVVLAGGEIVPLRESRPAITYDRARELLPQIESATAHLKRLTEWLVFVIEEECRSSGAAEVRAGAAIYTFRGSNVYTLDDAAALYRELTELVPAEITSEELEVALAADYIPQTIEYRVNHARLNELSKRGGRVKAAIDRHRKQMTTDPKLKRKGK